MNKITLRNLLMTMTGEFTYLSTLNESFPEKYRKEAYYYAGLYVDIVKNDDEALLDRYVEKIEMIPQTENMTLFDVVNGFFSPNPDGSNTPHAAVIAITLEEVSNKEST